MAAEPSMEVTITVPYSGEIKKGLLIIINFNKSFGTCLITRVVNNTFHTLNSTYKRGEFDIGIENITYSNGIFTLTLKTAIEGDYKVAFLQLNLD